MWRNEPQGKLVIGGWLEASLPFSTSTKNLGTGGNPKPYRRTTTTRARGTMIPCQACSQMRMSRSQVQRDAHTPRAGGQGGRANEATPGETKRAAGTTITCQTHSRIRMSHLYVQLSARDAHTPRAEGQEPRAKSRGPQAKRQEPRAKVEERAKLPLAK